MGLQEASQEHNTWEGVERKPALSFWLAEDWYWSSAANLRPGSAATHLPQNDVAGNETATENVSKWCRCCHLCHLCRYQWLTAPRHRSAPWRKVLATVAKSKPKTSWIPCTAILQMWQHRILVWNEKLSRNNSGTLGMDLPALWCILLHSLMFFGPILISSRYHSTLLLRFTSFILSPGL